MKINEKEIIWETYYARDKPIYCITSNKTRGQYKLYKIEDGKLVLIKKADTPVDFEKHINYDKEE